MSVLEIPLLFYLVVHGFAITAAIWNLFTHPFTKTSKLIWVLAILLIPLLGVLFFHIKYKLGWYVEKPYELSVIEAHARSVVGGGLF